MRRRKSAFDRAPFFLTVTLGREGVPDFKRYPFSIPAVATLERVDLHPEVTFLIGENGSGKSTLLEAIAVAAGFNPEGGSRNFSFATRSSESELHRHLKMSRGVNRPRDGFFLRAESYFNLATEIERLDEDPDSPSPPVIDSYGGVSLHEQSHGESFMALAQNRFSGNGFYVLDEPEAALSPTRQLSFLAVMDDLVRRRHSQFVIATHSPILMGYPYSSILQLSSDGLCQVAYEDTEHYKVTRNFLLHRNVMLKELLRSDDEEDDPAD